MTYTINLDLWIDEEGITEDEDIKYLLKRFLDSSVIKVSNIQVLDVND